MSSSTGGAQSAAAYRAARGRARARAQAILAAVLLVAGSRITTAQGAGAGGALTGRVVRPDGGPVTGAVVAVGYRGTDTATTSDDGRFAIHDVSAGPHMVVARHLGSHAVRLPVTLGPGESKDVTITLAQAVPVLPTVKTTAAMTAAYHEVGLDRRMRAGMGQFVTYDQIVRRQATSFTQLLELVRGLHVNSFSYADGSTAVGGVRGRGSCIGFLVDGMPQDSRTTDEINESIPPDIVGAIEYYRSTEAPAGWSVLAPGQDSLPNNNGVPEAPSQPNNTSNSTTGQNTPPLANTQRPMGTTPVETPHMAAKGRCDVIAVWTKQRLRISGEAPQGELPTDATRVVPHVVFSKGLSCQVRAPDDTLEVSVYASVLGGGTRSAPDSSWATYTGAVLSTLQKAYALPSQLEMSAFGSPLQVKHLTSGAEQPSDSALQIAPALSTVTSFTLDSTGAMTDLRLRASSLSGGADTSTLAALAEAGAAHAFPPIPAAVTNREPVHFAFVLSSADAPAGAHSVTVGHLSVPTWKVAHEATLAADSTPTLGADALAPGVAADTVALQFVVDERGRPIMSTARVVGTRNQSAAGPAHQQLVERVVRALPHFVFTPALIGTCPVPATVTQVFGWRRR